ncbi:MAG: prepilin peptidase [Chloroflexi bacterium]|nr:prepilin peptidase [Chloroflexota bacterium]
MVLIPALVGLLFGHLLDILLDRSYSESLVTGPIYRCPACRGEIHGVYLMPYVGYVWSRGLCRDCGEALPLRALVLPTGGAAAFVLAYYALEGFGAALLGGFFSTLFLALAVTDLERRLIPNRIVYPAIVLAAVFAWGWPDRGAAGVVVGGAVAVAIGVFLALFGLALFRTEAFFGGDVKLLALMGLTAGFPAVLVGFFAGVFAAGIVSTFLLLTRRVRMRDYIPYGPFLALGAIVATLWGPAIIDAYRE